MKMAGSGGDLDNCVQLEGGSDNTKIGNVSDRMKVDFSASPSGSEPIIPADEITYFHDFLKDGSTEDLSVDGSSTPVVYSAGPGSSENWYITELVIMIQDGGNLDATDYGSIAGGLTNGLLIEHSRNGTDYQIVNVKQNIGMAMSFSSTTIEGKAQGFLNDANIFVGAIRIEPEISLLGATTDVVKVTVQDDLSGLVLHKMAYRAWRIL